MFSSLQVEITQVSVTSCAESLHKRVVHLLVETIAFLGGLALTKKTTKKRTNIYIDQEQWLWLVQARQKLGRKSISHVIREAIDDYIKKYSSSVPQPTLTENEDEKGGLPYVSFEAEIRKNLQRILAILENPGDGDND